MSSSFHTIALVGAPESGKTAYITRFLTGDFTKEYNPTVASTRQYLFFNTNKGPLTLCVYDVSGDCPNLQWEFQSVEGCIAFFDLTRPVTAIRTQELVKEVRTISPNVPVVYCGNKIDLHEALKCPIKTKMDLKGTSLYFDVSAKSNYNFEKPFLAMARCLLQDPNLEFIPVDENIYRPILSPNPELVKQYEEEEIKFECNNNEEEGEEEGEIVDDRHFAQFLREASAEYNATWFDRWKDENLSFIKSKCLRAAKTTGLNCTSVYLRQYRYPLLMDKESIQDVIQNNLEDELGFSQVDAYLTIKKNKACTMKLDLWWD